MFFSRVDWGPGLPGCEVKCHSHHIMPSAYPTCGLGHLDGWSVSGVPLQDARLQGSPPQRGAAPASMVRDSSA
jgi:hypothetical protein